MKKKLLSILMSLALCLSLLPMPALAAQSSDIVVFYTNDIHTYIDNNGGEGNADGLTYSKVAALKDSYDNALLVDAGDHVQGTAYGQMDSGKTIIDMMNAADYDLATLGNHEFDYGQAGRIQVTDEWAAFDYVSCNFYHEENGAVGENVLDRYKLFDVNGTKVAFVGITTPEVGLNKLGYRRIMNGVSSYYEMNVVKTVDQDGEITFILGLRDIDGEMRRQLKQTREMETQREIIEASAPNTTLCCW